MTGKTQTGTPSKAAARQSTLTREVVEMRIARVLKWFFIALFVLMTAFPFYWMLNLSVRPIGDVLVNPTRLFPTGEQLANFWDAYSAVLVDFRFLTYIGNSLLLSLITVFFTLLLAVPGAYAVTRLSFRGKSAMSWGILLVYVFPAIVIAIPLFVIFSKLGVRGNLPSMIILYLVLTLPVALYMLRSYFQTIPAELD